MWVHVYMVAGALLNVELQMQSSKMGHERDVTVFLCAGVRDPRGFLAAPYRNHIVRLVQALATVWAGANVQVCLTLQRGVTLQRANTERTELQPPQRMLERIELVSLTKNLSAGACDAADRAVGAAGVGHDATLHLLLLPAWRHGVHDTLLRGRSQRLYSCCCRI